MSLQVLLEALGAQSVDDGQRIISEANAFLADLRELTHQSDFPAMLAFVRGVAAVKKEVEITTGKSSTEAMGVIAAWRVSHEQLPAVHQKVAELEEAARRSEVDALIKEGLTPPGPNAPKFAGKLTPATAKLFETRPAAEVRAFLEIAPRVIPSPLDPPALTQSSAPSLAIATLPDGRKFEDLRPRERAALQKEDAVLYQTLRQDWLARGEPATATR